MPIFTVGAAGTTSDSGFNVSNSLRFNSGSSDSITITNGSTTNRRTYTVSFWLKKTDTTTEQHPVFAGDLGGSNPYFDFRFDNTQIINWYHSDSSGNEEFNLKTNAMFRDPSAWYHFVLALDTTQATDSNRVKLYVNGVQITSFSKATYPAQNFDTAFNVSGYEVQFGAIRNNSPTLNGYMAEMVLIDGQQLTPTSFGEFDSDTGIWKPIDVSGLTFGTNGFHLNVPGPSTGQNANGLGGDSSGNGNHFASSGLSAEDQSTDTPTNNYSTLNSVANTPSTTFSEGNLKATISGVHVTNYGTQLFETGKWYFEAKATGGSKYTIGMTNVENASAYQQVSGTNNIVGYHANSYLKGDAIGLYYDTIRKNGSVVASGLHQWVTNDIAMVAIDADNGKIWFGANGTWDNSGDPAAGSGNRTTFTTGQLYIPAISNEDCEWEMNFGSPLYTISSGNSDGNGHGNFEYAVPNGFYAINTKNLAEFG